MFLFGNSIKYISENNNYDICVFDNGVCVVVVVNKDGKLRFRYIGFNFLIGVFKGNYIVFVVFYRNIFIFIFVGIIIDSYSRIFIMDFFNNCIYILDLDG